MTRTTIRLASSLIATTTACRAPEPAPETPQVCEALSAEEWQHLREQPLLSERPDLHSKLGAPLAFLVTAMQRTARGERVRPPPVFDVPPGCYPARVMVDMIHTGVDVQPIYDLGFVAMSHRVQPHRDTIASGLISPARLLDLASLPFVITIEAPATLSPELNKSAEVVGATGLRSEWTHNSLVPYPDGAGVIIALIDSGIDWRHDTFRKRDGRTRILAIWDQQLQREGDEVAGPNGWGVLYDARDIDHSLDLPVSGESQRPPAKVRHHDQPRKRSDDESHGTHVAGIAAGNGHAAHFLHPDGGKYVGIAPAADIVCVRLLGRVAASGPGAGNFQAAIDFIADLAERQQKACVINISGGDTLGGHDGSSPIERKLAEFMRPARTDQKTRLVVKSAGNEARTRRHVHAQIAPRASVHIDLDVDDGANLGNLEFWYPPTATLELELIAAGVDLGRHRQGPGGVVLSNRSLNQSEAETEQTIVDLNWRTSSGESTQIALVVTAQAGTIPPGRWRFTFTNPADVGSVDLHGWISKDSDFRFQAPNSPGDGIKASSSYTITVPGTGRDVITVANHKLEHCCWPWSEENLDKDSSRGPVRGNPPDNLKPTIAAPGDSAITSAKANAGWRRCQWLCSPWVETKHGGTSLSAPHVAGAVALLLQRHPYIPVAEVHRLLRESARDPQQPHSFSWGAGKLYVPGLFPVAPWLDAWTTPPPPVTDEPEHDQPEDGPPGVPGASHLLVTDATQRGHPLGALLRRGSASTATHDLTLLASRHFSELRRLVNTNHRIATLWHRLDGPNLMRRLVAGEDRVTIAAGATAYATRLLAQLQRFGSPALRQSILRYTDALLGLVTAAEVQPAARDVA